MTCLRRRRLVDVDALKNRRHRALFAITHRPKQQSEYFLPALTLSVFITDKRHYDQQYKLVIASDWMLLQTKIRSDRAVNRTTPSSTSCARHRPLHPPRLRHRDVSSTLRVGQHQLQHPHRKTTFSPKLRRNPIRSTSAPLFAVLLHC